MQFRANSFIHIEQRSNRAALPTAAADDGVDDHYYKP